MRGALVITVDRVGAGWIGPSGNTWLPTPELNRLASQSLALDNVLGDSSDLATIFRSYWTGRHATSAEEALGESAVGPASRLASSLPGLLTESGVRTVLVSDCPELLGHALAERFEHVVQVPEREATEAVGEIADTRMARVFSAAIDGLADFTPPCLYWVHARGMEAAWDAPLELRRELADEDDPQPPDDVAPPTRDLVDDHDPDELLGMVHCYAGQVMALDACLGALLDAWDALPVARDALLMFTSPRGYPLGEHGRVGARGAGLYGELLHVPWLVRYPHERHAAQRRDWLLQPADVGATLADWFQVELAHSDGLGLDRIRDDAPPRIALAGSGADQAIRVPAWFLRHADGQSRLFVKPDDYWEANDVANRCESVVEMLLAQCSRWHATRDSAQRRHAPLPEILVLGTD